ncbi:pirin family protein [Flagellimonas allohymeniacidonis]|uniref:Pirin family protein n=1 Tax=Flagellimonas allohymeniacidonis TaxID=2517819 RepID=A0A4Q8QJV5_9FLAO|nr:pirin family protein [Allomuricauda hymeniacidonis]TAI48779.1 pirin family protein [Allomuricauda hymeniacidonis]
MSNIGLIIEERSRDIGDFLVGRLIPFRKKRMIGPFIFIDHMGPTQLGPKHYMDVDQHPHIGLSTLTFMLEGEIMHEDSLGTKQRISPGSVNWMTAGSGVSHSERTPVDLRNGKVFTAHGYQIWVALPKHLEDMQPAFHHIPEDQLPQWKDGNAEFTLVAGEGYGKKSPVPVYSPLFMIQIKVKTSYQLNVQDALKGEIGICIVEGRIEACGQTIEKGNILVSKVEDTCNVKLQADTHLLLFGGEPFPEERHIYWNFVASSKEKIEQAKAGWKNKSFPMMPHDTSYVPLPGEKK